MVLVVISILVGLLFPALMAARERARRTRAEAEIRELQKAWQVYFTTYESFPSDGPMTKALTEVLAGSNPNKIQFMEFPEKALGNDGAKNGFRDPWGRHYEVEFDVEDSYEKKSAFQARVQCLNAQRYKY